MNVLIDKSIFSNYGSPEVDEGTFTRMLMCAKIKGYNVRIDSHCDFDDINADILSATLLASLMDSSLKTRYEKRNCDCTIAIGGEKELKKKVFSLNESCDYLSSTAVIMVEDKINDGRFIRAIERIFDPDLDFERLVDSSIVRFENAGGSGDKRQIEDELKRHNYASKYLRCVVIVDSDKRFPSDTRKEKIHKENRLYYEGTGVGYHVLEKRAMENYMPDEVFQTKRLEFGKLWVDAYLNLSAEQKDYLDISKGFMKDIPTGLSKQLNSLPQGMQILFWRVPDLNFQRLSDPPHIQGGDIKNNFPKLYLDEPSLVRWDTMMNRTRHQKDSHELLHISQMIRQII